MISNEAVSVDTQRVGRMGEIAVELALLARGWMVGNFNATTRNSAGWDLFAVRGERSIKIRVKTKRPGVTDFRWSAKKDGTILAGLNHSDDSDFVTAVSFRSLSTYGDFEVYVVPAAIVEKTLAENHAAYIAEPGRGGRSRKDSNQRNLVLDDRIDQIGHGYKVKWAEYRDAWDLLSVT